MIRMGKRSGNDQSESQGYSAQSTGQSTQYTSESISNPQRAISDSEAMARDIKEGRLSGFVGHGTVLSGETNFQAMLRVDGHLVGTVTSDSGTLIVGTNGQVDANVAVASALVNGVVNGDIVATERIQLGRTARVLGNIQTPRIIIEDGALFEGSCSMIKSREVVETKAAEAEAEYKGYSASQYSETSEEVEDDEATPSGDLFDDDAGEEQADSATVGVS